MHCLVTGGSGFFGHLLIEKLLARGDQVRSFDLIAAEDEFDEVEFQQGDIRDARAVRAACEGIDTIYHNVAQQPLSKDPELMRTVNVNGTRNLLSAARECGVGKTIFTSSTAIFGVPGELPIRRSTSPTPCEPYGRTKVKSEQLCQEYIDKGLDVTLVRPRTILGHGRLGIFQTLFEWIRQGRNVPVMGRGDNTFQFIHAYDLADACILAAQHRGPQVYNIGTDRFGTMRQALEALCRHANTGSQVKSVPATPVRWLMAGAERMRISPLGAYHYMAYGKPNYFDVSDAISELGWHPKYSNEEMMIASYDWYVENRDAVLSSRYGSPHRSAVKQGVLKLLIGFL
jgi:nucleoside-diphosphate-sugar epimerase